MNQAHGHDVIITGGRDYSDINTIEEVLNLFDISRLIQGGAAGADHIARMYADDHNIESVTVEADWDKHGRAAGPIRNREMLKSYPTAVVIAFPGGTGTENCVKTAISLGMIVLRVETK